MPDHEDLAPEDVEAARRAASDLGSSDPIVRWDACKALAQLGHAAVPHTDLLKQISETDADDDIRRSAKKALRELKNPAQKKPKPKKEIKKTIAPPLPEEVAPLYAPDVWPAPEPEPLLEPVPEPALEPAAPEAVAADVGPGGAPAGGGGQTAWRSAYDEPAASAADVLQRPEAGDAADAGDEVVDADDEVVNAGAGSAAGRVPRKKKTAPGAALAFTVWKPKDDGAPSAAAPAAAPPIPAEEPSEAPGAGAAPEEEATGPAATFQIGKEVFHMRLERAELRPFEVAAVWENEWGVLFASRIKFAAPPDSDAKWLNPREDALPCSPCVVKLGGASSILYTLAAAFRQYGRLTREEAVAERERRIEKQLAGAEDRAKTNQQELERFQERRRTARNSRPERAPPRY